MLKLPFLILLISLSIVSWSQFIPPKPGDAKPEDFSPVIVDSTAHAIVLFDIGRTTFDFFENTEQIFFKRHCRLLILDDEGVKEANQLIRLRHASEKTREHITSITGYVYNLVDGKVKRQKLADSQVFYEPFLAKIAFPQVMKNSIIEFTYQTSSPVFYNIAGWVFQWHIPVIKSEYTFEVPSYYGLNMQANGFKRIEERERIEEVKTFQITGLRGAPSSGQSVQARVTIVKYSEDNMPAFEAEEYVINPEEYVCQVQLNLSEVLYPNMGVPQKIAESWTDIILNYTRNKYFQEETFNPERMKTTLPDSITSMENTAGKVSAIKRFVKNRIKFNDKMAISPERRIKDILTEGNGTSAEINLVLLVLLRACDFDAHPVFISPRGNGIIKENFAEHDKIRATAVAVKSGGDWDFRDATNPYLKDDVLPLKFYNGTAILVINEKVSFVRPSLEKVKPKKIVSTEAMVHKGGQVTQKVSIFFNCFESAGYRKKLKATTPQEFLKDVAYSSDQYEVQNIVVVNPDQFNMPLNVQYELVSKTGSEPGKTVLMHAFNFHEFDSNPFLNARRLWPLDFPYPLSTTLHSTITFDPYYKLGNLPVASVGELPDKSATYSIMYSLNGNTLTASSKILFTSSQFKAAQFKGLGDMMEALLQKENETLLFQSAE